MPFVRAHRRRTPYSWFRSTTVRSHHRRRPGFPSIGIVITVAVILLIIMLAL